MKFDLGNGYEIDSDVPLAWAVYGPGLMCHGDSVDFLTFYDELAAQDCVDDWDIDDDSIRVVVPLYARNETEHHTRIQFVSEEES